MTPLVALIAAAALAVEAGWEPLADGGHQYTLQIEPSIIGLLENGNDLISEVPPQVHVRRLRVTIGTGAVTRIDGEPAAGQPQTTAAPPDEPRDHAVVAPTPAEEKFTMPAFPIDDETQHNPATPAGFSSQVNEARPLPTSADQQAQSHNAEKPRLDGEVLGTSRVRCEQALDAVGNRRGAVVLLAGCESLSGLDRLGSTGPLSGRAIAAAPAVA